MLLRALVIQTQDVFSDPKFKIISYYITFKYVQRRLNINSYQIQPYMHTYITYARARAHTHTHTHTHFNVHRRKRKAKIYLYSTFRITMGSEVREIIFSIRRACLAKFLRLVMLIAYERASSTYWKYSFYYPFVYLLSLLKKNEENEKD